MKSGQKLNLFEHLGAEAKQTNERERFASEYKVADVRLTEAPAAAAPEQLSRQEPDGTATQSWTLCHSVMGLVPLSHGPCATQSWALCSDGAHWRLSVLRIGV